MASVDECRGEDGRSMMGRRFGLLAIFVLLFSVRAGAQGLGEGALNGLIFPHDGKILHFSSYDRQYHNGDSRRIEPGQTFTLVDYTGAGVVRRWWVAISPRDNHIIQRQAIIRCYWDGEADPSVECPANDFFGVGFGEWHDYVSLPSNMTAGGTTSYWPMPFHKSARITITNTSNIPIDGFYFNIDVETHVKIPSKTLYFHAQFRRTKPTIQGQPVTILEATGRGQYVGTVLSMQILRGRGLPFLEGNERVFVDGETEPSINGTGTEDYFNGGWYFDSGLHSALFHGVTIKDEAVGRISAYRWHIPDPIPFKKSIRFTIEHGGENDVVGDYSSVAYWYQTHPHAKFPPLPADLLPSDPSVPFKVPGIIEGESLVPTAKATEGTLSAQDVSGLDGDWSGGAQLFWMPTHPAAKLTLTLNAPAAGNYNLIGYFTVAPDYGNLAVAVNGMPTGTFAGYAEHARPFGPTDLGRVALNAGANTIEVTISDKDSHSTNYYTGIDGFVLKPASP